MNTENVTEFFRLIAVASDFRLIGDYETAEEVTQEAWGLLNSEETSYVKAIIERPTMESSRRW